MHGQGCVLPVAKHARTSTAAITCHSRMEGSNDRCTFVTGHSNTCQPGRASRTTHRDRGSLTKDFIKTKQPCADGFRWFLRHHKDGSNYQDLLDTLANAGRVNDACWLLAQFGPTNETLILDHLSANAIVFAGSLRVRGNIDVDSVVRVGRGIAAKGTFEATERWSPGDASKPIGASRRAATSPSMYELQAAWNVRCGDRLDLSGQTSVGRAVIVQGTVAEARRWERDGPHESVNQVGHAAVQNLLFVMNNNRRMPTCSS